MVIAPKRLDHLFPTGSYLIILHPIFSTGGDAAPTAAASTEMKGGLSSLGISWDFHGWLLGVFLVVPGSLGIDCL